LGDPAWKTGGGTEWLIQQSKELKAFGVPVLHYYTLGKPKVIFNAVKAVV